MDLLGFVFVAYAILYVLWLLVAAISQIPRAAVDVTIVFIGVPLLASVALLLFVVISFLLPVYFVFSKEARNAFRSSYNL